MITANESEAWSMVAYAYALLFQAVRERPQRPGNC